MNYQVVFRFAKLIDDNSYEHGAIPIMSIVLGHDKDSNFMIGESIYIPDTITKDLEITNNCFIINEREYVFDENGEIEYILLGVRPFTPIESTIQGEGDFSLAIETGDLYSEWQRYENN